ncbi:hypothetical protein NW801_21890 [Brevibacillus laterosporus]|nr:MULTISPECIES: hypothetical protein [Brevibacillus]MCR8987644.1 hypothetical protein [Brevibacillus laterosporus]
MSFQTVMDNLSRHAATLIETSVLFLAAILISGSLFYLVQMIFTGTRNNLKIALSIRKSYKILRERQENRLRNKNMPPIFQWFNFLIQSTTKGNEKTTERFLMALAVLFSCSFVVMQVFNFTWSQEGFFAGLLFRIVVSILITSIPVQILVIRLRWIRIESGYDLAQLSGIFLSKYRKNNKRIYETLLDCAENVNNRNLKLRLQRIAMASQTYVEVSDLEKEIDIFYYSIETSFARQFGVILLKALTKRVDIEKSIEALDLALQQNIQMLNDEKSVNQDIIQLGWLHLVVFPISIWAVTFIDIPFKRHWQYQFETEQGRFWFLCSLVSVILSVFASIWFRKPKNDV